MHKGEVVVLVTGRLQLWIETQTSIDAHHVALFDPLFHLLGKEIAEAANGVVILLYHTLVARVGGVQAGCGERELGDGVLKDVAGLNIVYHPD